METYRAANRSAKQVTTRETVRDLAGSLFTVALTCPSCGGGISFAEGSTRVVCSHCGLAHMVMGEKGELRYVIPNRITSSAATRRVGELLKKTRRNQILHFVDSRLVYVPFFRVKVTGAGWYIGKAVGTAYVWRESRDSGETVIPREIKRRVVEGFFRHLSFFVPAVDISELGLIGIWAKSMVLELLPFDPDRILDGIIYSPLKESRTAAQEAWATLIASAKPTRMTFDYFEAEKVTEEVSMIHYPVWVVRFLHNGAPRRIVVDGVGGDVLNARVSKAGGVAAVPGIVILAVLAFLATSLPILLVFPSIYTIYLIIFNGWSWFWGTMVRLFVSPWRGEEG